MSGRSQLAVCQLTKWWVADLLARPPLEHIPEGESPTNRK